MQRTHQVEGQVKYEKDGIDYGRHSVALYERVYESNELGLEYFETLLFLLVMVFR